jgi:hypothetical protein
MILKDFLPKKISEKIGDFVSKQSQILKKLLITLVFEKIAIFSPKIGKNRRKL